MAQGTKGPVYMSVKITRNNFRRYHRRWNEASNSALVSAGKIGKDEAKAVLRRKQKTRGTQETQRSIGWRLQPSARGPKVLQITVGTLKGVFVEVGTKVRGRYGRGPAYHYLEAGMKKAAKSIPALVRAKMGRV